MDKKEIYENIRKSYRLVYGVQKSIVEMIEYIKVKIDCSDCCGKSLFSDSIHRKKSIDNYANHRVGNGMWTWDYFPSFMYMYYFSRKNKKEIKSRFSIIQVLDDGFISQYPGKNTCPDPSDFDNPSDAFSYLLLSFCTWTDKDKVFFNHNGKTNVKEIEEVIRIAKWIKENNDIEYIDSENDTKIFIVKKVLLENLGKKDDVDEMLKEFGNLVKEKTGLNLLRNE